MKDFTNLNEIFLFNNYIYKFILMKNSSYLLFEKTSKQLCNINLLQKVLMSSHFFCDIKIWKKILLTNVKSLLDL